MGRMNRHARRRAKFSTTLQASSGVSVAAPARPPQRRGLTFTMLAVTACAAIAYSAANLFSTPAASMTRPAPRVVAGDGVLGPKGMVWVPGGEFLMGSDHKLAQKNERPAHKVGVRGFWMDRTHVTNAQFA